MNTKHAQHIYKLILVYTKTLPIKLNTGFIANTQPQLTLSYENASEVEKLNCFCDCYLTI